MGTMAELPNQPYRQGHGNQGQLQEHRQGQLQLSTGARALQEASKAADRRIAELQELQEQRSNHM